MSQTLQQNKTHVPSAPHSSSQLLTAVGSQVPSRTSRDRRLASVQGWKIQMNLQCPSTDSIHRYSMLFVTPCHPKDPTKTCGSPLLPPPSQDEHRDFRRQKLKCSWTPCIPWFSQDTEAQKYWGKRNTDALLFMFLECFWHVGWIVHNRLTS